MIVAFRLSLCFALISLKTVNCQHESSIREKNDNPDSPAKGLFPNVFNLAAGSIITVNATCGETGPEYYCKLVDHVFERADTSSAQCSVCDAASADPTRRHPISNAIDGTDNWWQSPSLQNGNKFEWVTIKINLKQVYQIAYVILKSAITPLPGNWILEKSVDGQVYTPWQYFALSNNECWNFYRVKPTIGKIRYRSDDEVICTSFYARDDVIENGEVHASLINGRPGADGPSDTLREFTKAQFIRLRLQKIKKFHADLISLQSLDADKSITRRLFYSIKDISIGGQCLCNGHARDCRVSNAGASLPKCRCEHNTCGDACEKCCPLFNQIQWSAGTSGYASVCAMCQCYGHSDQCYFDQNVADRRASLAANGLYEGGGVCVGCKHHTTGINCEQCEDGYYRIEGAPLDKPDTCRRCQCSGPGVSPLCVKDDTHLIEGSKPGDCLCKVGFGGQRCDRCAKGYKAYPRCDECSCNYAGIVNSDTCDGQCICKANVEGTGCNKCRNGHYNLDSDNPDGCAQCYCFGATDKCKSSDWGIEIIRNTEDWLVTDLSGRVRVPPTEENGHLVIANDDIPPHVQNYYWQAPHDYLDQKLYSYGNDLKFIISYVVARGDVSGYFTDEADIILEGGPDNIRIGYKWHVPDKEDEVNATIIMPLREQSWFKVGDDGKRSNVPVSREEFTLLLYNMTRLLIRAKFHTDQIEGGLYRVDMEKASNASKSIKKAEGTEHCDCPPGYACLSCECCERGYRRVNNVLVNGVCEKCDCNNHADSCDAYTGECSECLHNTTGPNCGECKPGFYGNARIGLPDDCRPCACPLSIPSNNFSPTCRLEPQSRYGYVCDDCEEGYTGERCEVCADGWFGNPSIPGGYCQRCECGPNADTTQPGYCDNLTGQCRICIGNTGGPKCDECLPQHFGDPSRRDCKPCNCNPDGSEHLNCDPITGQCLCKANYTGLRCDRCAPGYGNIELFCQPCSCNLIGSTSQICDEVTGQCPCKPGVFGQHCDTCKDGHFGFSDKGCQWCACDQLGSESQKCNEITGQCQCKPFVIGRACDHCEPGFWNIASGKGCEPCNCNSTGSYGQTCDDLYGQCDCKPGVGGQHCDRCKPGYFGFSFSGCKQCDPCDAPGHICDPTTGKCVCPPNTAGPTCEDCALGTWGFNVLTGCQPCECNLQGSLNNECDHKTGDCICLEGFEGKHCDRCQYGYYRFPNCRRCDCHEPGTGPEQCRTDGRCQCDETGQCPCKTNVDGRSCDRCKEGSFALSPDNPHGCFECFCFGKSTKCEQSKMFWTRATMPQREVAFEIGNTDIKTFRNFRIIPETGETVGIRYIVDQPFYWSLPKEVLEDQVLSYNGFLRFRIHSRSGSKFPEAMLKRYPVVVIQGNHRLILHYFGPEHEKPPVSGLYQIRFHESEWIQSENPQFPVTRAIMMVALQKVQHILIRASDGADLKYVRITDTTLDYATNLLSSTPPAIGVEQCRCPPQYTAASCQDPNVGYYRKRKENYLDSKDILDLVGWAEPCACNNKSRTCDKETAVCQNCEGFTSGPYCNLCIKGYYGDPTRGIPCKPCACPSLANSFSDTCELRGTNDYICTDCKEGYSGRHCEICADGYWGNPSANKGVCKQCKCCATGSVSNICDKTTSQCPCKQGISGLDCCTCLPRHVLTETGCLSCDDNCTGLLLDDIEFLQEILQEINRTDYDNLILIRLFHLTNRFTRLRGEVNEYQYLIAHGQQVIGNFSISFDLETLADILYLKARDLRTRGPYIARDADKVRDDAQTLFDDLNDLWELILSVVELLRKYSVHTSESAGHPSDRMLQEAERILRELKARDFSLRMEGAQTELRLARNLLERVKLLLTDYKNTGDLDRRLDRLRELLSEIVTIVQQKVQTPTQTALALVQRSRPIQRAILESIENSTVHANIANTTLNEARDLLERAKNAIIEAAVTFDILPRLFAEVDNGTQQIEERRSVLARLNPEYAEKYVIPCQKRAEDLMEQVRYLMGLFNSTRVQAELPLRASNVYQKIIDALAAAEDAARRAYEAAERAYKEAYPGTDDALTEQARKAKQRSEELFEQARDIRDNRVPHLEKELAKKKYRLESLEDELVNGKRNLDLINRALDGLPRDLSGLLKGVTAKLKNILDGLADTHRRLDVIDSRIAMELLPKLERLRAGTTSGLENITKIIEQAKSDIRDASRLADRAEDIAERVNRLHGQMQLNLKDLKDKILLARQKAASIRVSLGTDRSGVCMRSYEPNIQPSISNNIVLNYAIKEEARDCLLFFVGSQRTDDFMAIEMVDRKIRFLWNAGGGTKMLAHTLNIETNDQQLLKDSQWYKIEVNRIGNMATLTVKRTPDGNNVDPFEISDTSPQGFNRMDLNHNSYFFIGGLPPDFRAPRELRSRSFAGCLYEVILDGKHVGLWNFTSNKGCDGCKEGATEPKDPSTFQFKGEDSYAILSQIRRYDKTKYLVSLQFKTFDEDALLFFSANQATGDFVSLTLKDGKVVYQFNMGTSARLTLTSKKKYNIGQWVRLAAEREKLEGVLSVEDEYLEGRVPAGSTTTLELSDSDLYFGGITPNFTAHHWPSVVFKPFLGCIKDAQVDTTPLNLLLMEAYGVDTGCREKTIKVVSFKGTGYLQLNSEPLREEADFSFTFKTAQSDALLLLSTFEGTRGSRNKDSHYYSISIVGGILEARFNGGVGETILNSESIAVNDGAYHTVTVSKRIRKILLSLDDREIGTTRLARGTKDIEAPTSGGLYLGGLPSGMSLKGMAGTKEPLKGVIRDAVFNGKLLRLNEPISFEGVGIGRETDAFYSTNGYDLSGERMESMPAHVETQTNNLFTEEDMHYSSEPRAVKLGDALYSHISLNREKREFTKNFSLSFEFRTHYPNGLFFLIRGNNKRLNKGFHFALALKDGYVVADLLEKKRSELISNNDKPLNDGLWHNITVAKEGKNFWMRVDSGKIVEISKVRRKIALKSPVYIGGTPEGFNYKSDDNLMRESFNGCIKNFHIGEQYVDLARTGLSHNVGECLTPRD